LIDWKSTLVFVIPAKPETSRFLTSNSNRTWMLAFARHDILRLKARDFNHPREKQESQTRGAEILAARLVVILSSLGKTSDVELALRRIKLLATKISY